MAKKGNRKPSKINKGGNGAAGGVVCNFCKMKGHKESDCRKKQAQNGNGNKSNDACAHCGKTNHRSEACFKNPNKNNNKNKNQSQEQHGKKTCNFCGKMGHLEEDCRNKKNGGQAQTSKGQGSWQTGNGVFLCPHCRNAVAHNPHEVCPYDPNIFTPREFGATSPTLALQQQQLYQNPDSSVPNATGYNTNIPTPAQDQWANTQCAHCGVYGHPASSCPILLNDKPQPIQHWAAPQPAQHSFSYNPYQNPLINAADAIEGYGWGQDMGMPRNGYRFNDATNPGSVVPVDRDGDVIMDSSEHFDAYVHHEHTKFNPLGDDCMFDDSII